jgi:hypothetical protein
METPGEASGMTGRNRRAMWLVAALTALLSGSVVGSTGLVLCIGANGHRALELEHTGMECPTLAGSQDAHGVSAQPSPKCLDVPAIGTGPTLLPSVDLGHLPPAPLAFLPATLEPARLVPMRVPTCVDPRAAPLALARHLRSTVLLV